MPVNPAPDPAAVVVAVQSTSPWKNKQLWLNVVAIAVSLLSTPAIVQALGPVVGASIITAVLATLNIILRLYSFNPLTGTPGATAAAVAQPAALAASVAAPSPTLVEVVPPPAGTPSRRATDQPPKP
jgi:hypothetical protein